MANALTSENAGGIFAAGVLQALQASTNKLAVKEFEEGTDRLETSIRWTIWIKDVSNQIQQLEGKTDPQKSQLLINSLSEKLKTKFYSTELATSEDSQLKNTIKTLQGIVSVANPEREAKDRYEMIMSKGPLEDAHDFLIRLEEAAVLCNFTNKKQKIAETMMTKCMDRRFMEKVDSANWTNASFDDMKQWAKRAVDLKKRIKTRHEMFKENTGHVNSIQQPEQQQPKCAQCNGSHNDANQCGAFGKSCWSCGGFNHYGFAPACPEYHNQGQYGYHQNVRPGYQPGRQQLPPRMSYGQPRGYSQPPRFGNPNQGFRPPRFRPQNQGFAPPRPPRFGSMNPRYPRMPSQFIRSPQQGFRGGFGSGFRGGFGSGFRGGSGNGFRGSGYRGGYYGNPGRINQICEDDGSSYEQYQDDESYDEYGYGYDIHQTEYEDPNYGYGPSQIEPSPNQADTSSQSQASHQNETTQQSSQHSQSQSQQQPSQQSDDSFETSFIKAIREIELEDK